MNQLRIISSRVSVVLSTMGCLALFLALASCGQSKPFDPAHCPQVPVNQQGSFYARDSAFPLQVVADNSFTDDERSTIAGAVMEWNHFSQALRGIDFFTLSFDSVPAPIRAADPKSCGNEFGYEQKFYIVREDSDDHWKSLLGQGSDNIPGVTFKCSQGDQMMQQIIYVKPVGVVASEQLQSVFNHELGHSLGLNHSCTMDSGSPDYVNCSELQGASHPYRQAVMYPSIQKPPTGMGPGVHIDRQYLEIKNNLQQNDKDRASCLYQQQ